MKLRLPNKYTDRMHYPDRNAQYYTGKEKKVIRNLLLSASSGYCMYCGATLVLDGVDTMQIEHSVDKEGNVGEDEKEETLRQCKFNLAAACSKCNMIYKKRVEKMDLTKYNLPTQCPPECKKPCKGYEDVRMAYSMNNSIILQPAGVIKDGVEYAIRYNLLRDLYEPDMDGKDEIDRLFAERHIKRFHLNGEKLSRNVLELCVDIVDLYEMKINVPSVTEFLNHYKIHRQINVSGVLFLDFLNSKFSKKDIKAMVDFCRMLVITSAII